MSHGRSASFVETAHPCETLGPSHYMHLYTIFYSIWTDMDFSMVDATLLHFASLFNTESYLSV